MPTMATLTICGRAAIAEAIAEKRLWLAWGSGEIAWDGLADGDLPKLANRKSLFNEVGRRACETIGFAEPDDAGDIVVPVALLPDGTVETARYARKSEPTPYLYFNVKYDFADAATETIRELGIFMGGFSLPDLPPGQRYFLPEQIREPGRLLAMQIVRPSILRSPSVRQIISFVLPV